MEPRLINLVHEERALIVRLSKSYRFDCLKHAQQILHCYDRDQINHFVRRLTDQVEDIDVIYLTEKSTQKWLETLLIIGTLIVNCGLEKKKVKDAVIALLLNSCESRRLQCKEQSSAKLRSQLVKSVIPSLIRSSAFTLPEHYTNSRKKWQANEGNKVAVEMIAPRYREAKRRKYDVPMPGPFYMRDAAVVRCIAHYATTLPTSHLIELRNALITPPQCMRSHADYHRMLTILSSTTIGRYTACTVRVNPIGCTCHAKCAGPIGSQSFETDIFDSSVTFSVGSLPVCGQCRLTPPRSVASMKKAKKKTGVKEPKLDLPEKTAPQKALFNPTHPEDCKLPAAKSVASMKEKEKKKTGGKEQKLDNTEKKSPKRPQFKPTHPVEDVLRRPRSDWFAGARQTIPANSRRMHTHLLPEVFSCSADRSVSMRNVRLLNYSEESCGTNKSVTNFSHRFYAFNVMTVLETFANLSRSPRTIEVYGICYGGSRKCYRKIHARIDVEQFGKNLFLWRCSSCTAKTVLRAGLKACCTRIEGLRERICSICGEVRYVKINFGPETALRFDFQNAATYSIEQTCLTDYFENKLKFGLPSMCRGCRMAARCPHLAETLFACQNLEIDRAVKLYCLYHKLKEFLRQDGRQNKP